MKSLGRMSEYFSRLYIGGFVMAKKAYSRKGFFGETIHYDANGKKIGESRKNFWGGYDHYDVSGKKTGTSREGFFGGMNHYDNNGNKTGTAEIVVENLIYKPRDILKIASAIYESLIVGGVIRNVEAVAAACR